jgi:hypothetical protein
MPCYGRPKGYRKLRLKIAKLGGLPANITPHVLRHHFASLASDLGYSEATIVTLIGHKDTTSHRDTSTPPSHVAGKHGGGGGQDRDAHGAIRSQFRIVIAANSVAVGPPLTRIIRVGRNDQRRACAPERSAFAPMPHRCANLASRSPHGVSSACAERIDTLGRPQSNAEPACGSPCDRALQPVPTGRSQYRADFRGTSVGVARTPSPGIAPCREAFAHDGRHHTFRPAA